MGADASAYAALGLEPGADASAVERAYKRLIKQHHPDREGGDSARAAEINRAYRELRGSAGPQDIILVHEPPPEESGGWVRVAVALLLALAVLFALTGPLSAYMRQLLEPRIPSFATGSTAGGQAPADIMDQPLHRAAIKEAVGEAMHRRGDENALIAASRECFRKLGLDPSLAQLDRCAAFDDAVVQLLDRDPMWDRGPFSQVAVTGRQWSGASGLSNDYLEVDSRMDRIRLQVELALAPPAPRPPAAADKISAEQQP
jgi:hypothetical protein